MSAGENTPSFYWYDFETFGLNRRADRPAQFAGMRTDMDFRPLDKGEILYCKPTKDYLPNPESCLLTGITPQLCEENGLSESQFSGEIWARFNRPETISIGYNSLGFDDEVCRFLFWRNFLDPYSHMWKSGCSRWDIFPLTCAVWSLRGNRICWPRWEEMDPATYPQAEGRQGVCFKLEFLSKANGIVHEHAHDALSDVEATLGLSKLIRETEPRLWQWALEHRTKAKVKEALETGRPVVWISPRFGQDTGFIRIAAMVAVNAQNVNEVFMWDLSRDPTVFTGLSEEEIKSRLFARRGTLPDGVDALPIYRLQVNASPFVCDNLRVIPGDRAALYGIDFNVIQENFRKLQAIKPLMEGPLLEFSENREHAEPGDVDFGLYEGGFPSREDVWQKERIRQSSPEALSRMVGEGLKFEDERLNELLFRYRARNWPELLTPSETEQWKAFCYERLMVSGVQEQNLLTMGAYFDRIDTLQEKYIENENAQTILNDLYDWGESLGDFCSE